MLNGILRVETQPREMLEQRGNRDLRLRAGERGAQAVMRAAAKGEVGPVRSLDIKPVRFGVLGRVMPCREQRASHRLTRLQLTAADLRGLQRKPANLRHWRIVAQHLLDRIGHEFGMRAQLGELIGVLEQREDAIADQVGGVKLPATTSRLAGLGDLAAIRFSPSGTEN